MANQITINELTEQYNEIKNSSVSNSNKTECLRVVIENLELSIEDVKNAVGQLGIDVVYWSKVINKKWVKNAFDEAFVLDSEHSIHKFDIESSVDISKEYNAIAFQRESVNKGYTLKQGLAQKSNENMAKSLGYNPFSVKLTVSGYTSPLQAIIERNTQLEAIFVESVDRLSRNLSLTIDLLDYCSLHKIKIFVGSSLMNRGIGRVTLLLLAVFAEFELTAKQVTYSGSLLNVIKFELNQIEFIELSEKEKKLFYNLQFVEIDQVFEKALKLATKYTFEYENKVKNVRGKLKANNPELYSNAQQIIKLLTEE